VVNVFSKPEFVFLKTGVEDECLQVTQAQAIVYSGHTNALTLNCVAILCTPGEVDGDFRSNISLLADRRQPGSDRAKQRLR
jgi:hypothetical protein